MFCSNCGSKVEEGVTFCGNCGNNLSAPVNNVPVNSVPVNNVTPSIPEEYKPIGMWGYFGYEILFAIPCVGFIVLLVFAFGGTRNINLRNFARSYFCFLIILVALALIIAAVFGIGLSSYGIISRN